MRGILIRLGKITKITIPVILGIFSFTQIVLASPITPEKIIELTNQKRIENGARALVVSPKLTRAAQNKAYDIATRNYWSHETPEGLPFWIFADKQNYEWVYLGENLAADFKNSEDVVNAWFLSPPHRKNILNENYQEIGIGVYKNIVVAEYGQGRQDFIHTISNNIFYFVSKLLDIFSF